MLLHSSLQLLLILFATGFVAGTIDAISGGGGLISLPMLLSVGVPPHLALGTNKLQSSVGTFIASCSYYHAGLFSLRTVYKGLLFGFAGALLGSMSGQVISSHILQQVIPILLIIIFIYTIFSPKLGIEDRKPLCGEFYFYIFAGFILGFYDGFFGPGTGSFWIFSLTYFLGYNLRKATAYTKIFNLKSNLIATVCFAAGHNIDYQIALCMAAGQLLGGRLGAHLAIHKGAKLIRPIFICIVATTIIFLSYKNFVEIYGSTQKFELYLNRYATTLFKGYYF
ncbi:hypothetical protein AYO45_02455 [Gammaproteobacteria bacterium SCGC AG-212-F23]|nr:hypothetical protein AYO45_02455 [Gammaproteobacteria bacterium SCGC AG-212-F23]